MRRRRFLQSAAVVPLGVVPMGMMTWAREMFALDERSPASDAPHGGVVVRAEKDVTGEPLHRPISQLAFKVTGAQTGGRLLLVEHTHLRKGGPPLHVHHEQEEWFLVEDGKAVFQVGDQRLTLGPGDSLLGPRGVPHTFSAIGDDPAKILIAFSPAGKMEEFFRDAQTVPFAKQDGAFYRKYGMEVVGEGIRE